MIDAQEFSRQILPFGVNFVFGKMEEFKYMPVGIFEIKGCNSGGIQIVRQSLGRGRNAGNAKQIKMRDGRLHAVHD